MMKDREQKAKAIKYCVSKGWFPQLEVDVHPPKALGKSTALMTDLDVLASMPDDFYGFRHVVFDCKATSKESPVHRALWLRGVLDRMRAEQGICVLRKKIELDHRLAATKQGIILLAEDELDLYARSTSKHYDDNLGHVAAIETWERFFALKERYQRLATAIDYSRSGYWMIDDPAEACRRTLGVMVDIRTELDPAKEEHVVIAFDLAALFARVLAMLVSYIFKAYLHPKRHSELDEAVKALLYGGREAYEHRNQLYRLLKERKGGDPENGDLSLPDWLKFIQLVRQLLDAPIDLAYVPMILREVAFSHLAQPTDLSYAKALVTESPQAGRFCILIVGYLFKAARLPPEFSEKGDTVLLSLLEK